MRFVSKTTLWIGVILALFGIGIWIWGGSIALQQYLALDALKSAPIDNPLVQFSIAALALLLGGFLWGLGVGLGRKEKAIAKASAAAGSAGTVSPAPSTPQRPTAGTGSSDQPQPTPPAA